MKPLSLATVGDLMDHTLHTSKISTTVSQAATIMTTAGVGSTLVMDGERLVGIFTERDVVRALSHSSESPATPIALWMTSNPQTISPSNQAEEALRRMLSGGFRHLPVVDDRGHIVGMLSMRDLARAGFQGGGTYQPVRK